MCCVPCASPCSRRAAASNGTRPAETTAPSKTHPVLIPSKVLQGAELFNLEEQSKSYLDLPLTRNRCEEHQHYLPTSTSWPIFIVQNSLLTATQSLFAHPLHATMKCPSAESTFHLLATKGLKHVHKDEQKSLQNPICLGSP